MEEHNTNNRLLYALMDQIENMDIAKNNVEPLWLTNQEQKVLIRALEAYKSMCLMKDYYYVPIPDNVFEDRTFK